MYNEALRIYEDCKKALKRELKTQPDSTTTGIYNRVLERIGGSRSTIRTGPNKEKLGKPR
jgi:hypothetical protein